VDASTIEGKCAEILKVYDTNEYQNDFAWIDNIKSVKEKDVIKKLNVKLFRSIKDLIAGKSADLHMSPPEIVDYTDGTELHYNGFGSHGTTFTSLSVEDYVAELKRCNFSGDVNDVVEKHRIKAKGKSTDEYSEKWRVFQCFVFETSLGSGSAKKHYNLFSGEWFQVEKKFKARIEKFYDSIDRVSIIGKTKCKNEVLLIDDIASSQKNLLKLDGVEINPEGLTHAFIEPCDFLSDKKEFIHLKDGHSSAMISHLWSQGVNSAAAFVSDPVFRKKLRAKVRSLRNGFQTHLVGCRSNLAR